MLVSRLFLSRAAIRHAKPHYLLNNVKLTKQSMAKFRDFNDKLYVRRIYKLSFLEVVKMELCFKPSLAAKRRF